MKFTEECVIFTVKHVLILKDVYKLAKHMFATVSLSQKSTE